MTEDIASNKEEKPKKRINPETVLTKKITTWLKKQPNCWYFKIASNAGAVAGFGIAQKRGVPDLYVVSDGKSYWFEVKTLIGQLSDVQKKVHLEMRQAGASVWTVRSLEEIQAILEGRVIEVEYQPSNSKPELPKSPKRRQNKQPTRQKA